MRESMTFTPEAALAETLLQCTSTDVEREKIISTVTEKLVSSAIDEASFSTASLLAELFEASAQSLSPATHDYVLGCLKTFISTALQQAEVDDLSYIRSLVNICQRCSTLLNILVNCCIQNLRRKITTLTHVSDGFGTPASSFLAKIVDQDTIFEDVGFVLDVVHCLNLLKVFAWSGISVPLNTYYILLILVGARDTDLAASCTSALVTLMSQDTRHVGRGKPSEFSDFTWSRILQLTKDPTNIKSNSHGYTIWSSLISSSTSLFPGKLLLESEEYWKVLQNGLAYGTAQHRKSCLLILKLSVGNIDGDVDCISMKVKPSTKKEVLHQFGRFATLFETIVLARYLNQVHDCLPDLTTISRPGSKVTGPWVIAIVHAALAHGMQDSIRKIIGDWMMEHGVRVLQQGILKAPEFLEKCFLPWASLGSHFTASIEIEKSRTPVSRHGERLCEFLTKFLVSDFDYHTRDEIIKAILNFLLAKTGPIYQFARAFILASLIQAVKMVNHEIDTEVVNLVLRCSNIVGFQEIVRDLMVLQCGTLVTLADRTTLINHNTRPLLGACSTLRETQEFDNNFPHASKHFDYLLAELDDEHIPDALDPSDKVLPSPISISDLHRCIKRSHARSLTGLGLKAACICLFEAIESVNFAFTKEMELQYVLNAVWDEVEVQEYPKQIIMRIPQIFLHEKCVRLCGTSQNLKSLICQVALEIQQLAEYKVYAFTPLASALRRCCLKVPEAVELPVIDLFSRFVIQPTTTKVEFQLEEAISSRLEVYVPHRTYSAYYGKKEAYGHACVFDTLNRLPHEGAWIDIRRQIIDSVMNKWILQKEPIPVFSRWKSSGQIQAILILFEGLIPHLSDEDLHYYLTACQRILSLEPMPRLRHLWEWIIARMCMMKPALRSTIWPPLKDVDLSNPKYVVSMQKVALSIARLPDSEEDTALELMTLLMPLAASPKIAVRHEAHWTVPALWERCKLQGWSSITQNPAFACLNAHIRGMDVYKAPPPGRLLENLDLDVDHTLAGIFQGSYLRIEPVEAPKVLREDFIAVYEDDASHLDLQKNGLIPLGEEPKDFQSTNQQILASLQATKESLVPSEIVVPLQTKASTWQDGVPGTINTENTNGSRKARDVIVISSLIDNAYNIGGLSRVGEIFGIKSLQIADRKVIKNKDFTSVSVSSHLWLPIEQLEVDSVPEFLVQRKMEGYTVIGIEQTDSSKVLGSSECTFPKKTVLVLGSEREGISARLLAEMDFCVEIKQVGITRSMNVQTAAAVVLYEYTRQHS